MKYFVRSICLAFSLMSLTAMADAPVVDDTENFALLEEQPQAAAEQPVAHESYTIRNDDSDAPLAHDSTVDTSSNTDLLNKIQGLQQDIQDLRGQLEVQANEINQLKQQQLSFYQDLDTRLNHTNLSNNTQRSDAQQSAEPTPQQATDTTTATEAMVASPTKPTVQTAPLLAETNNPRPNPADEQIGYLAAYDLIKQKQFPKATVAMSQFIAKYPHGGYSANAHYWLGELYLAGKDYANAITQFDSVIQDFKSSSKYAPSRLKLGYALAASGRIGEAKEQLLAVMKQYPDTSTAHLAHVKLESLGG